MAVIDFPIMYIPDPTKGRPLFNGQIFVGIPDLDPEVVINQKQLNVIQEDGTVVPVDQPFLLSAGGVPIYQNQTVRLDVDGNYSLKILDKLGAQTYFIDNVFEGQPVTELDLINDLSQAYDFDIRDDMINSLIAFPTNKRFKTKGFYAVGDDGGAEYIQTAGASPDIGSPALLSGYAKINNLTSIKQFGAKDEAAFDSTVFVQAMGDSAGFVFQDDGWVNPVEIDSVSFSATVAVSLDKLKLRTPSVLNSVGIILNGDNSICNIHDLNTNSTSRSSVSLSGNRCEVVLNNIYNVTADANSTTFVSGVEVNAGQGNVVTIDGHDFTRTGQANDSVPRLITIQGTASDTHIPSAKGTSVNCGVADTQIGNTKVDSLILEGATDNGAYALSAANPGTLSISYMRYYGSEESVVAKGAVTIGELELKGNSGAIGVDQSSPKPIHIDRITIDPAGEDGPSSIIRTRAGNVAAGKIYIGSVEGEFTGSTLWALTIGTVEEFIIHNVDIKWIYDAGISGAITSWGRMDIVSRYTLQNVNITIVDKNDILTGSNQFWIICPLTAALSYWIDVNVDIVNSDRETVSDADFRGSGVVRDRTIFKGCKIQSNIGPYVRESTFLGGQHDSLSQVPVVGTWRKGLDFNLGSAVSAPFRARCTVSGTPGTWVSY